ncbi:hypothetical protein WR25_18312 [Diploscapter pachys]|uniref:Uncharacterized protein n=1 Tax=Diploscapter pachys TaxID=2018661 RepID=A0A2A2KMT6_9BILA|nr:hypothetical protein WR25_18312 [Diploscapter pachys]
MNEKVASSMASHIGHKKTAASATNSSSGTATDTNESQKSPSALSSASDTASSTNSSLFGHLLPQDALSLSTNSAFMPQMQNSNLHDLPAPKPVVLRLKTEATEVEEEPVERPTDLSMKSAFSSLISGRKNDSLEADKQTIEEKTRADQEQQIHMQVALMLLLDQHSPTLVDRPGFRALLRYLLPDYQLPSSFVFQTVICPRLLDQMRQQLSSLFSLNNPILNPIEGLVTAAAAAQPIKQDVSEEHEQLKVDESGEEEAERESSSDVDMPSVEALGQLVDTSAYSKEEISSLVSVCHEIYSYFSSKPGVMAELQMWQPTSTVASIRELQFAHHNSSSIISYVRANPDMAVLPLSASQQAMLQDLVQKI